MLRQLSRQLQGLGSRTAALQRGLVAQAAATQPSSSGSAGGSTANQFYEVPEGHIKSDLSSTACNIGLTRRKELWLRQDLRLTVNGEDHSLADLLRGHRAVLFGVPDRGAVCSEKQVPGYLQEMDRLRRAGVTRVLCVTVGSGAEAEAWTDRLGLDNTCGVQVAADTNQGLTRFFGMELNPLGQPGPHSQRYAALVEDGILLKIRVEPGPGECEATSAEAMTELVEKCCKA